LEKGAKNIDTLHSFQPAPNFFVLGVSPSRKFQLHRLELDGSQMMRADCPPQGGWQGLALVRRAAMEAPQLQLGDKELTLQISPPTGFRDPTESS
jgi:hypothetical protein